MFPEGALRLTLEFFIKDNKFSISEEKNFVSLHDINESMAIP